MNQNLVLMFADLNDNAALKARLGDDAARALIVRALDLMRALTAKFNGRVIKNIGDELMCVFEDPSRAVLASNDMQMKVHDLAQAAPINFRVGLHYGEVIDEGDDVFGDTVNTAARIVAQAKPRQILITEMLVDALPGMFSGMVRFVDEAQLRGKAEPVRMFEVIWEVSDLTRVHDSGAKKARTTTMRCTLSVEGLGEMLVDSSRPALTIGRGATADFIVPSALASREHARVELRRGRIALIDQSANGTVVCPDGEAEINVRHGDTWLSSSGMIGLGERPEAGGPTTIRYVCEKV